MVDYSYQQGGYTSIETAGEGVKNFRFSGVHVTKDPMGIHHDTITKKARKLVLLALEAEENQGGLPDLLQQLQVGLGLAASLPGAAAERRKLSPEHYSNGHLWWSSSSRLTM